MKIGLSVITVTEYEDKVLWEMSLLTISNPLTQAFTMTLTNLTFSFIYMFTP